MVEVERVAGERDPYYNCKRQSGASGSRRKRFSPTSRQTDQYTPSILCPWAGTGYKPLI